MLFDHQIKKKLDTPHMMKTKMKMYEGDQLSTPLEKTKKKKKKNTCCISKHCLYFLFVFTSLS